MFVYSYVDLLSRWF